MTKAIIYATDHSMIKLTISTLKKTLAFGIALGVLGSILTNSVLELNVEAMDPKIELNTYVDPIKDLGIKPLLVTIKFDKDQLADDINNIISETSNIEVKEIKKNSKQLKLIKNKNKKSPNW